MAQQPGAVLQALTSSLRRRISPSPQQVNRAEKPQYGRRHLSTGGRQVGNITRHSRRQHGFLLDGQMGITGWQHSAGLGHHRRRIGSFLIASPRLPPRSGLRIRPSGSLKQFHNSTTHRRGDDLWGKRLAVELRMIAVGDGNLLAAYPGHDDDDARCSKGGRARKVEGA